MKEPTVPHHEIINFYYCFFSLLKFFELAISIKLCSSAIPPWRLECRFCSSLSGREKEIKFPFYTLEEKKNAMDSLQELQTLLFNLTVNRVALEIANCWLPSPNDDDNDNDTSSERNFSRIIDVNFSIAAALK